MSSWEATCQRADVLQPIYGHRRTIIIDKSYKELISWSSGKAAGHVDFINVFVDMLDLSRCEMTTAPQSRGKPVAIHEFMAETVDDVAIVLFPHKRIKGNPKTPSDDCPRLCHSPSQPFQHSQQRY